MEKPYARLCVRACMRVFVVRACVCMCTYRCCGTLPPVYPVCSVHVLKARSNINIDEVQIVTYKSPSCPPESMTPCRHQRSAPRCDLSLGENFLLQRRKYHIVTTTTARALVTTTGRSPVTLPSVTPSSRHIPVSDTVSRLQTQHTSMIGRRSSSCNSAYDDNKPGTTQL